VTPDQLQEMIQFRMQQAHETIYEAEVLIKVSSWRGAINRAYYAMFYAILALSTLKQVDASRHSGVITFFDREFIKPGIFKKELSKKLHFAFDNRQIHDYGETIFVDESIAIETLSNAKEFVDSINKYLDTSIYPSL
jgi:uncharacterized protein (UPF0332 family)